ncbi:MAG: acyl-CoA thioester hydrolase/BAAT C-terminal domain-containing protein, partial [Phenylobacterium sp.]
GEFYAPPAGKGPLLLLLGGSEGGVPSRAARDLNAQGFGVLALAYFMAPGVPQTLQSVPLEYFDTAVDWLAAQPTGTRRRVAIVGVSKGAEAGLLEGSRNPRVCAVVAGLPSSVAWAGVNMQNLADPKPSWTSGGQPVAYAPYDFASGRFKSIIDLYTRSFAKAQPEAHIPVEKIRGPVLLISGRQDALWPSTAMGDAIMARLDAATFRYPHQHLAYDNAGHAAFGKPPAPGVVVPAAMIAQAGGTAEGNVAARVDSWPKTLAFLNEAYRKGCR